MSTIEDDARAEAEKRYPALQPDAEELTYPRSSLREFKRGAFVVGYIAGYLAASRREPSEAKCEHESWEANLTYRRCADCREVLPEPSDTDEREWEYGTRSPVTKEDVPRRNEEWTRAAVAAIPGYVLIRRRKAGPWEVCDAE